MEPVLFEKGDGIGRLTMNRPEKRNALSLELMESMLDRLDQVAADPEIGVVIISGNGPVFSAGHDLREMGADGNDVHFFRKVFDTCNRMMLRLHEIPQPVIARVHGVATAAGCQMVAACDLAIAESGARFATSGIKVGLFCATPMVPLVRVVGRRRAMDMLVTGRFISAQDAENYGLVNRVVPPDRLIEETNDWALEIARHSFFALSLGKRAFYEHVDMEENAAYGYAREVMVRNCLAEDAREGIGAFLEKRKPEWRNK